MITDLHMPIAKVCKCVAETNEVENDLTQKVKTREIIAEIKHTMPTLNLKIMYIYVSRFFPNAFLLNSMLLNNHLT